MELKEIKESFIRKVIKEIDNSYYEDMDKKFIENELLILEQGLDKEEDFLLDIQDKEISVYVLDKREETGGYESIHINVYISNTDVNYHYVIEIGLIMRMWGFCLCEPTDEGYDEEHKCCGTSCDWYAPKFELKRVIWQGSYSFKGLEKDLWKAEKDFMNKYFTTDELKEAKREEILERIEGLKEEIKCWEEKLDRL